MKKTLGCMLASVFLVAPVSSFGELSAKDNHIRRGPKPMKVDRRYPGGHRSPRYNNPRRGRGGYANYQTLRIPMYGEHLRGQNIIPIKRKIKQLYGHMNLRDMNLVGVTMLAKSKMGRAQASLIVGQEESYPQTIYGHPQNFHNPSSRSFSQVYLQNPAYGSSQGKWQIALRGNIKVQELIVQVQAGHGYGNQIEISVGQHLRGQQVLGLKRLVKQMYPHLDLQSTHIESVVVMAKSKMGRGQISLVARDTSSYPQTVPGDSYSFHDNSPYSFYRINLQNPQYYAGGKLQLHTRGNIKIDRIIVKLSRRY